MADEVMTAVRVACAGRTTAHVRLPEHADHAALKAAAGAALGDPYDLRLAAPRALRPGDDPWAPLWEREDWGAVPLVRQLEDDDGWQAARTSWKRRRDGRIGRRARARAEEWRRAADSFRATGVLVVSLEV